MSSPTRSRIAAWASWDCGATGMSAIVTTFVFSVYLTGSVGVHVPGQPSPASWLGRALALAGFCRRRAGTRYRRPGAGRIAALQIAPDPADPSAPRSPPRWSLIRPHPSYLFAGLALLAATAACLDLATVPHNAMLRQLDAADIRPDIRIRCSGRLFRQRSAVAGGVLRIRRRLRSAPGSWESRLTTAQNVRAAMLLTAAWLLIFATPLMFTAHRIGTRMPFRRTNRLRWAPNRKVWADLIAEWRADRNLVYYLMSSAIFRDGLTGVRLRGGPGREVRPSQTDAALRRRGVRAAAAGAVVGSHVDDRVGSKPVIVTSLISMMVIGLILLTPSGSDRVLGARAVAVPVRRPHPFGSPHMMLRMCAHGREGGVRSVHDDRAGGQHSGALDVLHLRRRLRCRPAGLGCWWCWAPD